MSGHLTQYMHHYVEATVLGFQKVFGVDVEPKSGEDRTPSVNVDQGIETQHRYIIQIPFSGVISGEYFLCLDVDCWRKFISSNFALFTC